MVTKQKVTDLTLTKVAMIQPNLILKPNTDAGKLWLQYMLTSVHWDYVEGAPYFDKETALEMSYVAKSDGLTVD